MTDEKEILATVDLLYRAALEQHLWPEALESFAQAVGCIGMAMIPITPNNTAGLIVSPSMREVEAEYTRTWWQHDTRVARIFDRRLSRGVFRESQLFGDGELARDPFRQEFCRDHGIGAFAAQLIEPLPGHVVAFSGQRTLRLGQFEDEEISRLTRVGRHAARALTISLKLTSGESIVDGLLSVLDRFDGGVFALNASRDVILMNARAEAMLGDGLDVVDGQLTVAGADRQRALDRLITSGQGDATGPAAPIALQRPSGRRPLIAQAMPLPARPHFGRAGVLVLVVDTGLGAPVIFRSLRLLGLTAAEARLAALIGSGMRRRQAAEVLGISEWTARDTLKTVYSKLEITSSAGLVRLVEQVAAIEGPQPGR